ncbi:MAG TPA: HNH endonuclease signature motif containing protein [Chloroflexota bacterium]|nr:HNH endonuclease signature motif containing protein [Chloroflexota bacterium]HUM69001.1 HNH endonuclease signature motif containing protein [Chloroflexota bacterium]
MSSTYIPAPLRQEVILRANGLCEYCLIHQDDSYFGCQVDHIISEKHGGPTELDNLAYACTFCNRQKGSDVGSIDWESSDFIRFFNPRIDRWSEHFNLDGYQIVPLTAVGRVTGRILGFNSVDRLLERQELHGLGRYPSSEAQAVIDL